MDAETAKNFYDNYEWFNQFFRDLSGLYDSLGSSLTALKYEESANRWYHRAREQPSLPDKYLAFYADGEARQLVVATLLRKPGNEHMLIKEPVLAIIAHDSKANRTYNVATDVITGDKIKEYEPSEDKTSFRGVLNWEEPIAFHGFFVPLDAFSEQNCTDVDATVREKVIEPLRVILNEHFSKSGKKSKTEE